jgi:hypothetical protein
MTPEQKQEAIDKQVFDWRTAFKTQQAFKDKNYSSGNKLPVPPNPFFKELKVDGKILIGFSSEIKIVPNLEMINNGTIYLDELQE